MFELWYFDWSAEKEVMIGIGGIVTRQSLALFKAHLFCQENVSMPWYWKRRSSTEKEGYGETELMGYASGMPSHREKKHHHRLLCSSHSWSWAVLPVRLSQLVLPGSAVNPDVRDEAISLWSWQPGGRLFPQQVPSQKAHCLKAEADWLQNWLLAY